MEEKVSLDKLFNGPVKVEPKPKFDLSGEQVEAVAFLLGPQPVKLLRGSAGVGKTTVVGEFTKQFKRHKIILSAPTHKAVKVLHDKSGAICKTIHSFLKLDRKLVKGQYVWVFDEDQDFDNIDVLVVDEASMMSHFLLECLFKISDRFDIVFVGDDKQLNPVGEEKSMVFHLGIPQYELKEIRRHDNDIIDLSRNLDWVQQRRSGENFTFVDRHNVPVDLLVEANGTDLCKFITWSNRTVTSMNRQIRNMIYEEPAEFEIGETILMREVYKGLYKNNDEVIIGELKESHQYFEEADIPFPYVNTWLVNKNLHIVQQAEMKKYEKNVAALKQGAKYKTNRWSSYYKYRDETFGKVQYNHALTTHKSQGSGYKTTLVHATEMLRNPNPDERARMLYTAITRAEEKIYLV